MSDKRIDKYVFNQKDQIGEGSYATVYKGTNEKTGEKVAIKMLSKSIINADSYLREGLVSEIKVMQKLKSPNIVALLDVMETSNNYYIIQEFCDGGDLDELISKKKSLPEPEALKFLNDILNGFLQLIRNGIIHRDLKPANILIDKGVQQSYKLADFGFAKTVDNFKKDMMSSMVGTPLYMSPQILDNKKYTNKTDIWSLGFIFYETLFGKNYLAPWTARSPNELLKNIRNQPLKFIGNTSNEIKDLLTCCLQADEEKRISWDEIYRHPALKGKFDDMLKQSTEKLEDKAKYLVTNIRQMINREQTNIAKLFQELDMSKDKYLDIKELERFLQRIDKSITHDEVEYVFNKLDEDGNNQVEFEEFRKWLEKNEVRMSQEVHRNAKRLSILQLPGHKPQGTIEERALYVMDKLKLAIVKYKIQLIDLFNKFDKSSDHNLDEDEMGQLLKRIEPSITPEEIHAVFEAFDFNKDGEISFQEFQEGLSECLILQQQQPQKKGSLLVQEESKNQTK